MTEKKSASTVIMAFLAIIVIGLSGYLIYDNVLSKEKTPDNTETETKEPEKVPSGKVYVAEDYISITDVKINENCSDCKSSGIVKKIDFKKLPFRLISEFISNQTSFLYPSAFETGEFSNEIIYDINQNILSIYTKEMKKKIEAELNPVTNYKYYSVNINLDDFKIITNQELLEMYQIKGNDVYSKILNQIASTVTTKEFLLSTLDGEDTITIEQFTKNIKEYANYMDNQLDKITLYVKDNKVFATYNQNIILSALGMGTSMNEGLVIMPQSIQLN